MVVTASDMPGRVAGKMESVARRQHGLARGGARGLVSLGLGSRAGHSPAGGGPGLLASRLSHLVVRGGPRRDSARAPHPRRPEPDTATPPFMPSHPSRPSPTSPSSRIHPRPGRYDVSPTRSRHEEGSRLAVGARLRLRGSLQSRRHPRGFALFFHNYSTFSSAAALLAELFVRPEHRAALGPRAAGPLARYPRAGLRRLSVGCSLGTSAIGFY